MQLKLPTAQGRVLRESLNGTLAQRIDAYKVTPTSLRPAQSATGLSAQRVDGSPLAARQFSFVLQMKQLQMEGKTWTYFDQASPERQ